MCLRQHAGEHSTDNNCGLADSVGPTAARQAAARSFALVTDRRCAYLHIVRVSGSRYASCTSVVRARHQHRLICRRCLQFSFETHLAGAMADENDYPLTGETLGLWRLVSGLGRGGMGEVYEAVYDFLHLPTMRHTPEERGVIKRELARLPRAEQSSGFRNAR